MMTDPIADMLTRIRNANKARHERVDIPASKLKVNIAKILKDEGYIKNYNLVKDSKQGILQVFLKYGSKGDRVISELKRVSKPSLRVYVNKDNIPLTRGGFGSAVLSTSKGILSAEEAKRQGVGGEIICSYW